MTNQTLGRNLHLDRTLRVLGSYRLAASEPARDHVGRNAAREVAPAEGAACNVRGLAELVAPREGQGVHHGEDQGDDNERQPHEGEPHQRQDEHDYPEDRLHVQRQPEEPAVRGVDGPGRRIAALKHPLGIARRRVDLVPPSQPYKASSRNILQVVEIGREEEYRDDEGHDHALNYP